MRTSSQLCGIAGCTAAWNATQNLLALVAGSSTDTVGIELEQSSILQGAAYAVNDYRESNSVRMWGPVIARQVHQMNSTENTTCRSGRCFPGCPRARTRRSRSSPSKGRGTGG